MTKRKLTNLGNIRLRESAGTFEEVHNQKIIPYDENLLERSRTQWQFGEWEKLASIERETLQHHPDRAKLALLTASGRLQLGDTKNARSFLRLAKDWGCSGRLISQILVSGVHNSLGKAFALTMNQGRSIQHFEKSLEIGMPSSEFKLLSKIRNLKQVTENREYLEVFDHEKPEARLAELYTNHAGYVSDKWALYLQVYNSILTPFRKMPISLLEIGVQNGGSLEIWERFFDNARIIVGCDIDQKCSELEYGSNKIQVVIGDIKSKETQDLITAFSATFDIIIDDGSHKSSDVISAFFSLFPILRHGGLYVIEDMHCSYWNDWEGGLDEKKSSVSFFKSLVDLLNYEHWECDLSKKSRLNNLGFYPMDLVADCISEIHSIKFYNSMCVVEKRKKMENLLGRRFVVGVDEKVCAVKKFNGDASVI